VPGTLLLDVLEAVQVFPVGNEYVVFTSNCGSVAEVAVAALDILGKTNTIIKSNV